jgi:hypothetical protein
MAKAALILCLSAIFHLSHALPAIISNLNPDAQAGYMPRSLDSLERFLHRTPNVGGRISLFSATSPNKMILRGGKLDGFSSVIIDNSAAADHFESLLCTSRSAIAKAYRSIDRDDSGHISKAELKDALHILGVIATDKEVESIFNGLDENKDGVISFEVSALFDYSATASTMHTASCSLQHPLYAELHHTWNMNFKLEPR